MTLYLRGNKIGDQGAEYFANALQINTVRQILNVFHIYLYGLIADTHNTRFGIEWYW
jgi:hypothetical protein